MCLEEPTTDAEFALHFKQILTVPSSVSAGPICKFARWESVQACWQWYRGEFFYQKPILMDMGGTTDQMLQDIHSNQTCMHDSELAVRMTQDKKGLLARAPTYISMTTAQHL